MNRFLLPCPCGGRIAVTVGQAGDQVRCPACGSSRTVPRLGALKQLEPATADKGVPRRWTFGHACGLAGVVAAGIAGGAALWIRSTTEAAIDEVTIRAAVAGTPITEVYRVWPMLRRGGIVRPPLPEEERRIRIARSTAAIERMLWLTALVGATVAIGGGLMLAFSGGRPQRGAGD